MYMFQMCCLSYKEYKAMKKVLNEYKKRGKITFVDEGLFAEGKKKAYFYVIHSESKEVLEKIKYTQNEYATKEIFGW